MPRANLSTDMTHQDHLLTCVDNHGVIGKHADPTEGAREGLTVDEALEIARVDASLIWVDFEPEAKKVALGTPLTFTAFAEKWLHLQCAAFETKEGTRAELNVWWPESERAVADVYTYTADAFSAAPEGSIFRLTVDNANASFLFEIIAP